MQRLCLIVVMMNNPLNSYEGEFFYMDIASVIVFFCVATALLKNFSLFVPLKSQLHLRPIESSSPQSSSLETLTYLDSHLKFFCYMNSIFGNNNLDQGIVGQGKACRLRGNGEHIRLETANHHKCWALSNLSLSNRKEIVRKITTISLLEVWNMCKITINNATNTTILRHWNLS